MVKPLTIRGKTYPSAKHAARALGVSVQTIYNLKHRGRLDYAGTRKSPKPIEIDGVRYPSQTAAARALGISRSKFRRNFCE